jgi:hypothetical protein
MHNFDVQVWQEPPHGARQWLSKAITSVREGLLPHRKAPKFFGRREPPKRTFPSLNDLKTMPNSQDGRNRIDALDEWENPALAHVEDVQVRGPSGEPNA